MDWKTPAWKMPVGMADRVELFCLPDRSIVSEEGWPDAFWQHVSERLLVFGDEAQRVICLFRDLEPGVSARCHIPPWGLAFYEQDTLLFTATLCYLCDNAYIYTAQGKELRAFDPAGPNATQLRDVLKQHLSLHE